MGLFSEMMDEAGDLKSKNHRLVQILGSIARGRNGTPITGKDAMMRAQVTLDELGIEWRTSPVPNGQRGGEG